MMDKKYRRERRPAVSKPKVRREFCPTNKGWGWVVISMDKQDLSAAHLDYLTNLALEDFSGIPRKHLYILIYIKAKSRMGQMAIHFRQPVDCVTKKYKNIKELDFEDLDAG